VISSTFFKFELKESRSLTLEATGKNVNPVAHIGAAGFFRFGSE
jgi:hypothetical protein